MYFNLGPVSSSTKWGNYTWMIFKVPLSYTILWKDSSTLHILTWYGVVVNSKRRLGLGRMGSDHIHSVFEGQTFLHCIFSSLPPLHSSGINKRMLLKADRSWNLVKSFLSGRPKSIAFSFLFVCLFYFYKAQLLIFNSVQFSSSVVSNSLWPHGLQHARPPCPSQLPEFTQTHVDWVGEAIQPSHPLSSPSPSAFNLSQHQGLFKWVSSSHQMAKVLEFQLQHQSLQWTARTDLL